MSYILDALRRADAERERGSVPGLHSQPVPAAGADAPRRLGRGPWVAAGLGLGLVLLGVFAWVLAGAPAKPPPVRAAVPAPLASAAPTVPPPAEPTPPPPPRSQFPPAPLPPEPVAEKAPLPVPQAAAPAPAPVPPNERVVAYERVPDDLRRQLPVLTIGGAIHSPDAASRMLIVGGQLLHEGDAVAPGVTIEQIRPKSAVLRWKDLRYEVTF